VTNTERTRTGWETIDDDQCRRATTVMEMVGRRWSGAILLAIGRGANRFSEIAATIEGLSDRMLALRLKELEQSGLVDRTVEPTVPVSVRYHLSPRGRDLLASLQPIARYANRWEPEPGR
jgi:DNA-binding HxlR family transcriptional regulator